MPIAGAELSEGVATRDGDRLERLGDRRVAIAELAGGVGAPAIGLVAQRLGAGGLTAGRHAADAEPARHLPRPETEIGTTVADRAPAAVSPAEGAIAGGHGAGEIPAHVDLPKDVPAHHRGRLGPVQDVGAVAKLARVVVAPAERAARGGDPARVRVRGADLAEAQPTPKPVPAWGSG